MSTQAVWKFGIPLYGPGSDHFSIDTPADAKVMSVQLQYGEPQMWALVSPASPMTARHFRIAGTGHPIDDDVSEYVGTFQIASGSLVFHIFEIVGGRL